MLKNHYPFHLNPVKHTTLSCSTLAKYKYRNKTIIVIMPLISIIL